MRTSRFAVAAPTGSLDCVCSDTKNDTEVTRPARVVHTEQFDDPAFPGESLETWIFEERDGVTTFTMTLSYDSVEARNRALESGMEQGNAACYDRLAALLA